MNLDDLCSPARSCLAWQAGLCPKIYVTDSDDNKNIGNPPDELKYYALSQSGSKWYLQDFYDTSDVWYIGEVQALAQIHSPIPGTVWIFGAGLIGLVGIRRKFQK